jgi:hypothetical protein
MIDAPFLLVVPTVFLCVVVAAWALAMAGHAWQLLFVRRLA